MENQKKFFFKKDEKVLDLFNKLERDQMKKIVGGDRDRVYAESTGTQKPKTPVLK